jgi:solute:Na+ symporter, SSS family
MQLAGLDWAIIVGFFAFWLVLGAFVGRKAGESTEQFFLAGRSMPWWLLGFSLVATTFAADTPLFVSGLVRQRGVAGNWNWWAFLLNGMLTVFVFAKLWHRSGLHTDLEFYELRYSGKPAAFLRGFRALYLGTFFNIMIMAVVTLAAIKISGVLIGLDPWTTIIAAAVITAIFSGTGGLKSVIWVDAFMFMVAMAGAIGAAVVAVQDKHVGGLSGLFSNPAVQKRMGMLPAFDLSTNETRTELLTTLLIPLIVQWWSVWYPGAEPGGGGYVVQRMLAAKSDRHATGATLFFNVCHYALRPWPWIIVGLASIIVFPTLQSLKDACPYVDPKVVSDDISYPAMLLLLPAGLKGLVVASLIAAYMSTIATHLNWGSSYVVYDFWKRFVRVGAPERELVLVGRISTVSLMILAAIAARFLQNTIQGFEILLQIGAGTGLLFILRWFWWRINPYSEIVAMCVSFAMAIWTEIFFPVQAATWIKDHMGVTDDGLAGFKLILGVVVTTAAWVIATLVTPHDDEEKLLSFYNKVKPGGIGWRRVVNLAAARGIPMAKAPTHIPLALTCIVAGCIAIYGALFASGSFLYGNMLTGSVLTVITLVAAWILWASWMRISAD